MRRRTTTISGAGRDLTVIDAGGIDRVLELPLSGTIEIQDLTLRGGRLAGDRGCGIRNRSTAHLTLRYVRMTVNRCDGASPTADEGGAIHVDGSARLTLDYGVIEGNFAERGAGISSTVGAEVAIFDSTIRDNEAHASGGGVAGGGDWLVADSTISGNSGGGATFYAGTFRFYSSTVSNNDGWAIRTSNSTLTLDNTTVVENYVFEAIEQLSGGSVSLRNSIVVNDKLATGAECSPGTVTSLGYNLTGDATCGSSTGDQVATDPQLGPLRDNGGPTRTHYPDEGSPLIDAGAPGGCVDSAGFFSTEQRGAARIVDGNGDSVARCDIGSVEWAPEPGSAWLAVGAFAALGAVRRAHL